MSPPSGHGRAVLLREPLFAFLAATGVAALALRLGHVFPLVEENQHGVVALAFLYLPWLAARWSRRPFDHRAAGLHVQPLGLGLRALALVLVVSWPIYLVGFFVFYGSVCGPALPEALRALAAPFAPLCRVWLGSAGTLRLPPDFAWLALSQVVVVALPEELFFRGYLYTRLRERWPDRGRLLGAPVGPALWLTALLFALGHVLVDLDPRRMAVFFPGLLFGWLRARTGSLLAGVLYHALCNLLSEVLFVSYFG